MTDKEGRRRRRIARRFLEDPVPPRTHRDKERKDEGQPRKERRP